MVKAHVHKPPITTMLAIESVEAAFICTPFIKLEGDIESPIVQRYFLISLPILTIRYNTHRLPCLHCLCYHLVVHAGLR